MGDQCSGRRVDIRTNIMLNLTSLDNEILSTPDPVSDIKKQVMGATAISER